MTREIASTQEWVTLTYNPQVIEMLEKALSDVKDTSISTTSLLYQCLHIANLLDLSESEKEWIELELSGYPPQTLEILVDQPNINGHAPHYRILKLPSEYRSFKYSLRVRGVFPSLAETVFVVTEPCDYLETTKESLALTLQSVTEEDRSRFGVLHQPDGDVILYTGSLSPSRMRGIVAAIRSKVLAFVSSHLASFQMTKSMKVSIERMRNRLASKLVDFDPSLLQIIREAFNRLETGDFYLLEKTSVETLRTIMRRFTQILYKNAFPKEIPPRESEISVKVEKVLNLVCESIVKDSDTSKRKRVKRIAKGLEEQSSLISELVNRPIHKDTDEWSIGTADRLLIWTLLWMDEMLFFIDQTMVP